jgi:hypothetical protein
MLSRYDSIAFSSLAILVILHSTACKLAVPGVSRQSFLDAAW